MALLPGACTASIDATDERDAARASPGMLCSIETAGGYPGPVLRALIRRQGFAEQLPTRYGVSLYRVRSVDGLTVRASAPIAGPFDLAALSLPFALEGHSRASSLYLAYMLNGYANVYGQALGSALRPPYVSTVPVLLAWFDELAPGTPP